MTVNKEILTHPDFIANLADELCKMLEALIDAEFDKGDETDFDFIDECADAINAIRSGDEAQILPVISRKDFLKKVGIKTESKFRYFVAACAAIAVAFTAGTQIEVRENVSLVQAFSGMVADFFTGEVKFEETEPPETATALPVTELTEVQTTAPATSTTAPQSTTAVTEPETQTPSKAPSLVGISVQTMPEFKAEYNVGEKFNRNGIRVFGEYDNGEKLIVRIEDYTVEVSDTFGTQPKYETVKITVGKFTKTLEVRVIETLETKKLSSIYAIFPENFDFTTEDLENVDLSAMQVYAVYSNGDETELSADEYTVEIEIEKTIFKPKEAFVTVSYEGCSCSFMVFKEQQIK